MPSIVDRVFSIDFYKLPVGIAVPNQSSGPGTWLIWWCLLNTHGVGGLILETA